jgi:translation elongation factor EF-Ts
MINRLILAATFIGIAICGFSQTRHDHWAEMKTFHSFMAATFHPAEIGNLAPLKAKADSLLIEAKLWQNSAIPAEYKPAETKAVLEELVKKCAEISETAKIDPKKVYQKIIDEKLNKLIGEAHEIFHKVIGECLKNND